MAGNVPVDEAIRLVGVELSRRNQNAVLGTTAAEKELLARYAAKGKQRSLVGTVVGTGVMGALWRWSGQKRRIVGAIAMTSGALLGMSYGVLSIRRDLFAELLTLPAEQSPFAGRARKILHEKIPDNSFVKELRERMRNSGATFDDAWDQPFETPKPAEALPEHPSRFPPLPDALPVEPTRIATPPNHPTEPVPWEKDAASGADADIARRSPFFFFNRPAADDDSRDSRGADRNLPPLPRDPYAPAYSSSQLSEHGKRDEYLRNDEDEYFFGIPSDSDKPVKAKTWDDIRRQAAARDQHRK